MKKSMKYTFALFALLLLPFLGKAQTSQEEVGFYETYQLEIVLGLALAVCFIALIVLLVSLYALTTVLGIRLSSDTAKPVKKEGFWRRFLTKMNDAVPVSQENKVLTDHEYDGIRELDNKLPPWWVYMFYATIIFGIGYLAFYHLMDAGLSQEEEYQAEMEEARVQVEAYLASLDEVIDETSVTFTAEEGDLITGQELFSVNCTPCHGTKGGGVEGLGPNLTDKYWIHGGDIKDIFATIKYGVPAKGMIPWEAQLSPKQMQQLSSYIISIEGQETINNKAPEGELYEREPADNVETREEIVEEATTEEAAE